MVYNRLGRLHKRLWTSVWKRGQTRFPEAQLTRELTLEELDAEFSERIEKSIVESGIDVTTSRGIAIRKWVMGQVRKPSEFPYDDIEVAMDDIRRFVERRKADRQQRVVDDGQSGNSAL